VQSTALRPLADHGKAALRLHRVRKKLRQCFDTFIAAKFWAKAPSFRLIQVSSGRSLVTDKHTRPSHAELPSARGCCAPSSGCLIAAT
jgi:hypothetical protein